MNNPGFNPGKMIHHIASVIANDEEAKQFLPLLLITDKKQISNIEQGMSNDEVESSPKGAQRE